MAPILIIRIFNTLRKKLVFPVFNPDFASFLRQLALSLFRDVQYLAHADDGKARDDTHE